MPTENYYRLLIDGPPRGVVKFRADETVWDIQPWLGFFGGAKLREDNAESGRLVYMWADDYKRPGPNVDDIAALHPELAMVLEWSAEGGSVAKRVRYVRGAKVDEVGVDALELEWMEWEEEAE